MNKENEIEKKYKEALEFLSKEFPPCEFDGFMDKNVDYCSMNCGVDEEVFKQCWDRYFEQAMNKKE